MDGLLHGCQIHTAFRSVRHPDDLHAEALGQGEVLDLVGDVVVAGGGEDVTGPEGDGREGGDERGRGVLRERYPIRAGAEPGGDPSVCVLDGRGGLLGGFVSPDLRLELDVANHRLQHRRRHEGGTGVVQVHAGDGAGRVGAERAERSRDGPVTGSVRRIPRRSAGGTLMRPRRR